jgi:glycerol-3-phosphate acyltransferase PlsY
MAVDGGESGDRHQIERAAGIAHGELTAAVYGHCYTPWLRLRGGKGVATYLGATFALSWPAGLAFACVWLAIVLPTGFASIGSIVGVVISGLVLVFVDREYGASGLLYAFLCAFIVIVKHRENLVRLASGTENRLQLLRR